MDFPTHRDLFRIARDEVLLKNGHLTKEIIEREGTDANAVTAASAGVGDEVVGQLVSVQTGLFLDTAKGTKLDRLAWDRHWQSVRKAAAPARVDVEFSNPTAVATSFTIPVNTHLKSTDGKQFVTTAARVWPAGASGPITVPVQSVLAGLDQQVRAGTITSILDTITNAPGTLTVTNPLASAGADNGEDDDAFRTRTRAVYKTIRRGTQAAILLGVLSVPGVRTAEVFEVVGSVGQPARLVQAVVADAFTEQLIDETTLPATYTTQSQVLAEDVRVGLEDIRACGIQVHILVANVVLIGVTLALRFQAGADVDAAAAGARSAIVSYVNDLVPGETFVVQDAEDALRTVPGLIVTGGEVYSPAGDVVPSMLEVLRTSFSMVALGSGE